MKRKQDREFGNAVLSLVVAMLAGVSSVEAGATAMSGLRSKLGPGRRAEAEFHQSRPGLDGKLMVSRGKLSLESPDRVRLDHDNGEKLALRKDGGEWLQPVARQLIQLDADQAATATRLWAAFLAPAQGAWVEHRLGARSASFLPTEEAEWDSAGLVLDAAGLPERLTIHMPGQEPTEFRFRRWTFTKARGASAFSLRAPAGVVVVPMP